MTNSMCGRPVGTIYPLEFIKVKDGLPAYGKSVLIRSGNTVQGLTYVREGGDDTEDWFEPYYFECSEQFYLEVNDVTEWAYLPE